MTTTCLVTGGTGGIGLEAVRALARSGVRVLLTARTSAQGEATVARLRSETGHEEIDWVQLDLGSLESVRACARAVAERCPRLDVLVANAGVFAQRGRTTDGFELVFGTNYLGHFLLLQLLLPQLRAAAAPRVVLVASDLAAAARELNFESFIRRTPRRPVPPYAASKLALLLLQQELLRRPETKGLRVHAVHPGFARTGISTYHRIARFLRLGADPFDAAKPIVTAAIDPALGTTNGRYLGPDGSDFPLPALARDEALAARLWERSLAWTGCLARAADEAGRYEREDGLWGPFRIDRSAEEMAALTQHVTAEILPRPTHRGLAWNVVRSLLRGDPGSGLVALLQHLRGHYWYERHLDSEALWRICNEPAILEALREYLGPDLVLWRSELWMNRPAEQVVGAWHHDSYPKLLRGEGRSVNLYLALTDVALENGFEFIPKRREIALRTALRDPFSGNSFYRPSADLDTAARRLQLKAGEFVLFTNDLVHRSVLNTSGRTRIALTIRVAQPSIELKGGYTSTFRAVRLGASEPGLLPT